MKTRKVDTRFMNEANEIKLKLEKEYNKIISDFKARYTKIELLVKDYYEHEYGDKNNIFEEIEEDKMFDYNKDLKPDRWSSFGYYVIKREDKKRPKKYYVGFCLNEYDSSKITICGIECGSSDFVNKIHGMKKDMTNESKKLVRIKELIAFIDSIYYE